jgi:hypothetical protein
MQVAYTVIQGNYDTLKNPFISKGWRYVCFTDQPIKSDIWEIRPLSGKHNRDLKINCPFQWLTLYVDASIEIVGDLNEFASEVPGWYSIWLHPHCQCTYTEAERVIDMKGMDELEVNDMMLRYMEEGFPRNFGLGANGIMLRDMSDKAVRQICRLWWDEFVEGPQRDQLSLMYSFWKSGYKPDLFSSEIMRKYFVWHRHK